ncbi:hypothetical protein [Sporomusa aerivorans]|uniref:hypothetical protein n=1 Tax=Sporomusa aerivorans TaxID=204936 RepID=UPI00352B8749
MMDDTKFLQHMFDGYVHCYRRLNWNTQGTDSDMTALELGHFADLGQKLGFLTTREKTMRGKNSKAERPDLFWQSDKLNPILYMERENSDKTTIIRGTIDKLFKYDEECYLSAVFGGIESNDYQMVTNYISKKIKANQLFLLIAWIKEGNSDKVDPLEVHARVYSGDQQWEKKANVKKDEDGYYWYLYFEPTTT